MFWFCKTGTIGIMLGIVPLGLKMRPARNCSVLLVYQSDKRKSWSSGNKDMTNDYDMTKHLY